MQKRSLHRANAEEETLGSNKVLLLQIAPLGPRIKNILIFIEKND
jgi:hypothetical protein